MASLTDAMIVKVTDAINIFDKKGDGKLPIRSMLDCLRSLGFNPLQAEVDKIVEDTVDNGQETRIELDEFLPIYEYFLGKRKPTINELCDGLKSLDPKKADAGRWFVRVSMFLSRKI